MKVFSMLIVALAVLAGVNAKAATKSEVWELLQRVDGELRYYEQDAITLDSVKTSLLNALDALRRNPGNTQGCTDFAYNEYRRDGFSNSTSLDKAKAFCQSMDAQGTDLQVIQYMYRILRQDGYSVRTSFDYSLTLGKNVTVQNLTCVDTAYNRYHQDGYSGRTSLEKAIGFCRN